MYLYVWVYAGAQGGQERTLDPLKLELQVVVSCLMEREDLNLGPLQEPQEFFLFPIYFKKIFASQIF